MNLQLKWASSIFIAGNSLNPPGSIELDLILLPVKCQFKSIFLYQICTYSKRLTGEHLIHNLHVKQTVLFKCGTAFQAIHVIKKHLQLTITDPYDCCLHLITLEMYLFSTLFRKAGNKISFTTVKTFFTFTVLTYHWWPVWLVEVGNLVLYNYMFISVRICF